MPRPSSSIDRTSQRPSALRLHVDMPLVVGRVDRVQDEVEDHLGQVVAHHEDGGQVGGNVGRDRPLLGALIVLGDPQRLVNDFADPDPGDGREAGREKSISSRMVRSIRWSCRPARSSFSEV